MSLFEQILQTNLINFIIVISTLVWIFKKANLGAIIEKLSQDVKDKVEKSSLDTQNAIKEFKETKKSIKDVPKLQEEIISQSKENANNIKQKIEEQAQNQSNEIKNNLEKLLSSQKESYKNCTIDEVYKVCVDIAENEVIKRLNPQTQKRLIEVSINELDKIEGNLL